ncbi:myeloid leukemia factor [Culicoides brevitarsis]|uniref:myeloid leukemia factor n=1 Tax=Culicoides brevitarsis TaxID=469753 RepID=UPI00307B6EAA
MSLFTSLGLEDDPIFGAHMRQMRQMNNMMNSLFGDPFGGMMGGMGGMGAMNGMNAIAGPQQMFSRQLMPMFSNNMSNRLLTDLPTAPGGVGYSSSSVFSMTTGPDGKPQIYQATSSTKQGPGGIRETRKTLQDTRTGTKKMSIGHHIGDRAHVIEKSQDLSTGQLEENEELINLDEEEKETFNREFTQRARSLGGTRRHGPEIQAIMPAASPSGGSSSSSSVAAIQNANGTTKSTSTATTTPTTPATESVLERLSKKYGKSPQLATPRRAIRTPASSPLASTTTLLDKTVSTSVHPHPYNPSSRKHKAIKGSTNYMQRHH